MGAVPPKRLPLYLTAGVVVNLLLGWLAIIPIALLWAVLQSSVLRNLGWSAGGAIDDDEVGLALIVGVILAVPLGMAFLLINHLLRSKANFTVGQYWLVAAALLFLPLIISLVANALWGASLWTPFSLLKP